MRIKVLGSAAGGGFPQWNCACANCRRFRSGKFRGRPRSQTQLAFTTNDKVWFLLSASPDLRTQIAAAPQLSPSAANSNSKTASPESDESPIGGVFLPSADVDSVAGLLHLREFQTFFVFATPSVQRALQKENRIFRVLDRAEPPVKWVTLSSKGRMGCHLDEEPGSQPEFLCTTVPLGGTYPDYVSEELRRSLAPEEATSGFVIYQGDKRFFYAPAIPAEAHNPSATGSSNWKSWLENSDAAFVDGTFWSDDELIKTGRSKKSAREIGHLPLSGPEGLLERYPKSSKGRRFLIHINNTNPILDEDSPQHRAVLDAGFEIAYDGMELQL
jgi:pyrroloquinoline quinone biosynthesis protein B